MSHVLDQIHDWFIGALESVESDAIDLHLAECQICQKAFEDYLMLLPEVDLIPPSDALLKLATPYARFSRFTKEIAKLADVNFERAKEWLSKIDTAETWRQSVLPTMQLFDIEGGPAVENAILGFVRFDTGTGFPEHKHFGLEYMFILQGTLIDEDGSIYGPGQLVEHPKGTQHSFLSGDRVPLIYLTVNQVGVEVGGKFIGPESDDL